MERARDQTQFTRGKTPLAQCRAVDGHIVGSTAATNAFTSSKKTPAELLSLSILPSDSGDVSNDGQRV
jgi:hypothetical protein